MRRDPSYLLDMLSSARDVVEFASNLTFPQFEQDRLRWSAILKAIEIIGEAASHLSANTKDAHPEIEWHKIIGMRHHLVHGYSDIDNELVWKAIQEDIPSLISKLKSIVPPETEQ